MPNELTIKVQRGSKTFRIPREKETLVQLVIFTSKDNRKSLTRK
jgi:hypothetical protein